MGIKHLELGCGNFRSWKWVKEPHPSKIVRGIQKSATSAVPRASDVLCRQTVIDTRFSKEERYTAARASGLDSVVKSGVSPPSFCSLGHEVPARPGGCMYVG